MTVEAPKIDPRTREEVALEVRHQLARAFPGWPVQTSGGAADALTGVFAQLCGIVIDRLNKAPRKNMMAFLDMLGATPTPAQAARVPLTFSLAAQHTGHVIVPALTQIAAALDKGEEQPVLFETERELVVTSASLVALCTKVEAADRFDDHSAILERAAAGGIPIFQGTKLLPHELYLDLDLPSPVPVLEQIGLSFEFEEPAQAVAQNWLQWEIWRGKSQPVTPLQPASDGTQGLTRNGEIIFVSPPSIPLTEANGQKGYWLRCRTLVPLSAGMRVPTVKAITVRLESAKQNLPVEAALANSAVLDPTKDFFPFGRQPAFGDTFYLASAEAFSKAGASITMHIALANPASGPNSSPIPAAKASSVRLRWEMWDGTHWIGVGASDSSREIHDEAGFSDNTKALTESGSVTLRVPLSASSLKMAGQNSFWIRVRLIGGDYGRPATYGRGRDGAYEFTRDTYAAPAITTVNIDYSLRFTTALRKIFTYNDFSYSEVDPKKGPFSPFEIPSETPAYCYFGFVAKGYSDRSMSIYLAIESPTDRKNLQAASTTAPAALIWEYWNGSLWTKWTVIDDTDAFRRSGLIRFLAPRDFFVRDVLGRSANWLRVRYETSWGYEPRLRLVALNTTMAAQTVTLTAEVLGSSDGTPAQQFRTIRAPVLSGQQLEVLEPGVPSAAARRAIQDDEGDDAIRPSDPLDVRGEGMWVRWHEVPNFNGSAPGDRHYVLNRETGQVIFGDDLRGRVPPAGSRNIVMARYQTGGGVAGNRKVHTIEQLKTAIPYLAKVTNPEPASGGADAESLDRLIGRAPRQLRHGYRAVTSQDFEDMAMLASPEIARARCIPLFDLVQDPRTLQPRPGVVSLIIAPLLGASDEFTARPRPSIELIRRVRDFLDRHRLAEADLVIVGPDYVAIKVETEITVSDVDTASDVELAVSRTISRFLHPTLGRRDGMGWQFGQEPTSSDIYSLIEDVPGVDHVRELKLTRIEDWPGAYKTGHFLICSVEPRVTATLEK